MDKLEEITRKLNAMKLEFKEIQEELEVFKELFATIEEAKEIEEEFKKLELEKNINEEIEAVSKMDKAMDDHKKTFDC